MTTTAEVLDIMADEPDTEPDTEPEGGRSALPSPRALYNRWEQQQWSVAKVRVDRDSATWAALLPFAKQELGDALAELEVGEVCVTRTLSALADHAPGDEDRIYLCTQLADEGRHVTFFQEYLTVAAGISIDDSLAAASAYGQLFEPRLYASTGRVRATNGDRAAWLEALVEYHLITEGVLAATALRSTRVLARRFKLDALDEGLTNVARDESRHLTYGLAAAHRGVETGHADLVARSYLSGVELAARVLVNPYKKAVAPVMKVALIARAKQLSTQWQLALDRAVRQLRLIGLPQLRGEVEHAWRGAQERALVEYRERWDTEHPVVKAGLVAAA
jgi:ribonucleoside-diphosphate reductase beta chain